jgi:thioredoxin 1
MNPARDRAGQIQTVTGATFDHLVLHGHGPIAVEFMSYGCAHCRVIEPFLERAAHDVRATEDVFRVNIAVEEDLARQYAIDGTPTFVMFLDGREVGRAEGPHPTLPGVMAALTTPFAS